MDVISYSDARKNLKSVMDKVVADHSEAIITRRHGGYYFVMTKEGQEIACRIKGVLNKEGKHNLAVVGDRVLLEINGETALIQKILPRESVLQRAKGFARKMGNKEHKEGQILIANIDQVFILMPCKEPDLHPLLLDRFLALVANMGLKAVIGVGKWDLAEDKEVLNQMLEPYEKCGYPVVRFSIKTGYQIDLVKQVLNGKVNFLMGPSGAGKSSLVNLLNKDLDLRTSSWSERCKTGPQTTTFTALYPLWANTFVADTAGFSQIFLFHVSKYDLRFLYPEFEGLPKCKYLDCLHDGEDGCLIEDYQAKNLVDTGRFMRYRKLLLECNPKRL